MKKNSVIAHYRAFDDYLSAYSAFQTETLAVWTNTRAVAANIFDSQTQMQNRTAINDYGSLLSAMLWSNMRCGLLQRIISFRTARFKLWIKRAGPANAADWVDAECSGYSHLGIVLSVFLYK